MSSSSKPNLNSTQRNLVAQFLLQNSEDGKLLRGVIQKAAAKFKVHRRTVKRIWMRSKQQIEHGIPIHLKSKKIEAARSNKLILDVKKLKSSKLAERGTVRGLADCLNVSSSTAWRWIHEGLIRSHTNAIKAELKQQCIMTRFKFCLKSIFLDMEVNVWKFKSMSHIIHIDEKWFYLTQNSEKYYLHPDEEEPYRACKSKKFITKVMIFCAVARPLYNIDGTLLFDGKIGIFPFTHQVPAQRSSKNRRAGTLETKDIASIIKEVIKSCIINQVSKHQTPSACFQTSSLGNTHKSLLTKIELLVGDILPAKVNHIKVSNMDNVLTSSNGDILCRLYLQLKVNGPSFESTNILIQQDNARPHISDNDVDFRAVASTDGFNMHLISQPINSPDLNINDLGWFRALQSLQTKRSSINIDQLVAAVESSFTDLHHTKLNKVFLSLQGCMIEILKVRGHNRYKVPHMGKDALIRHDILPKNLVVEEKLDQGETEGFENMVDHFDITGLHL